MKRQLVSFTSLVLLLFTLSACAPGADLFQSPTFRFIPEGSGLQRLEPPGVGSGQAVFRINLEVSNPNPVGLHLAGLDFDLAVNGRQAVSSSFNGGLRLAAQGSSRLALDVIVPLDNALGLAEDLARLIAGEATRYTLTGTATIEIFGMRRQLPSAVLASGTVSQPLRLVAPQIRYLPEVSGLRELSFNRAVVEVGLELSNPSPLGYLFRAPDLALRLGGMPVAGGQLVSEAVPAFGSQRVTLRFEFNPASLGAALYGQLATLSVAGGVNLAVAGDFALEIPGITRRSFPAERLASAVLR